MSDLLTRLAERALGRTAPTLEPRLPSRYADAPAAGDASSGFSELSVETEAPRVSPSPRPGGRFESPPPRRRDPASPPPSPSPSPRDASRREGAVDEHPSAPAREDGDAPGPRDAAPSLSTEPRVMPKEEPAIEEPSSSPRHDPASRSSAVHPPAAGPAGAGMGDGTADGGFHEVELPVDAGGRAAGDASLPRSPSPSPAEVRQGGELRPRAGATERASASPPSTRSPVVAGAPEAGRPDEAVRTARGDDARRPEAEGEEDDGLREVVTVIERGAAPPARQGAVVRGPAPAARETAAEAREAAERRPVVRVTIGRIEVRAAAQPAAPAPAPRAGWAPPVMPLGEFLKREAER